jgi:hypothetical protein
MKGLVFEYPAWYLLICLLIGAGLAAALYFRDKSFGDQPAWVVGTMALLRGIVATALAILLMEPLLRRLETTSKKPVIVLGQDASASVAAGTPTSTLEAFASDWEALQIALSADFEVLSYTFGTSVREGSDFSFPDQATNISAFLDYVDDVHGNERLGAIVLATDGTFNQGSNPAYLPGGAAAPLFAIGLGDTTIRKDLIVTNVFHNKIAYLGDQVSFQVDISAKNAAGNTTNLRVYRIATDGKRELLQQIALNLDNNDFFATREIVLEASEAGVQRYQFVLDPIRDEAVEANNTRDVFLDVLDARQKILLLAHAPHPDLSALRQSLSLNKNYEVTLAYAKNFKGNPGDYDFAVLHQLPARNNRAEVLLSTLEAKNIPRLFILGQQSDLNAINTVQSVVQIRADYRSSNEVQATVADNFTLFTLDAALKSDLPNFAPLLAPFGEFTASEDAQVLLYQRIGKVVTDYPLMVLGNQGTTRVGVLCAEGVWKWRLFDYLQHENQDIFREFIQQSTQFLSVKADKRKFRVDLPKIIFDENEPLRFSAQLYNDNYELVNDPDVSLVIRDGSGNDYPFTLDKTTNAYQLQTSSFPAGNYTFQAKTTYGGNAFTYEGRFSVQPIQLEVYETQADHRLLRLLSSQSGGAMLSPDQLSMLPGLLENQSTLKPIVYQTVKTRPVIDLRLLFFLLLLLLTAEWFMRRYLGSY